MERDLPRLNQLPLPTQMLMLMPGTATTDTDTVAMDGEVTAGLTATTVTTERGPLMLNLQLSQLLLLTLMLTLMRGTTLRIPWLWMGWLLQALRLLRILWKEVR